MKKYFETPAVNAIEFDAVDLIMASAELVKRNTGLGAIQDTDEPKADLWMGANEGWL
ncbi:MAG: hypothetical protein J1F63_10225 [Oscillospiraceae bacterium]|nr:hypothetical protein [Oscillospiraceae bacterium]